jgi:hypothetical protein
MSSSFARRVQTASADASIQTDADILITVNALFRRVSFQPSDGENIQAAQERIIA